MSKWFAVGSLALAIALCVSLGGRHASASAAAPSGGAALFAANCSSCHGATGQGMTGAVPPLAKNAVVVGSAARVIHIVKTGLDGNVMVNGVAYDGRMPAWTGVLSPTQMASVITFIRSSWGNKAGVVTVAQVNATK
jgi:mono/diheme cytochrome c family protein